MMDVLFWGAASFGAGVWVGVPLLRVNVDEMNAQPPVWERRKAVEERMAVS